MLELTSPTLRLAVRPEIGGAIARFDWIKDGKQIEVFRSWDGHSDDPNLHACYPLIPWSNRISGGGIEADGSFWPLQPNWPGQPYPIHGDGWRRPWRVERHTAAEIMLGLDSNEQPPFDYHAQLTYGLTGDSLTMRLSVEHRGGVPAPYGLGFHPWLPRTAGTLLELPATEVWLETADHMPAGKVPIGDRPNWSFAQARPLPTSWINNGFTGWSGTAGVIWPEHRLQVSVRATPELGTCIVYSPSADASFFCLEPVSHPVDAFHFPGMPGLRVLQAGQRPDVVCTFNVTAVTG